MHIKKVISAFLLLACLFPPLSTKAQKRIGPRLQQPPSAADVAAAAMRSVVSIVGLDAMGQPLASGSGFFIDRDTVLTNYHVVKDAQRILVSEIRGDRRQVAAMLTCTDATRDLAVLKPIGIVGTPLKAAETKHRVGDRVYVIGNPEGLAGTFSEGIISAFRVLDGTGYVQITAPISHGSSGGPVLDESGRVVGIATAFIKNGQNLNLAVELNGADLVYLPFVVTDAGKNRERGAAILEAALVAKGRRDKLLGVRDYTLRLQLSKIIDGQEIKGESIGQYLLPDKLRTEWVPIGDQKTVMARNGDSGWIQEGGRTIDLPPRWVKRMEEDINHTSAIFFLKLPEGSTVVALPDETVSGQPADVLLLTGPDDFNMTLFFDKSNHLLLRSAYDTLDLITGKKRPGYEVYSDYKQVNGFWIPFSTSRFVDGIRFEEQSLSELKVNSRLDPSILDAPQFAPTQKQSIENPSTAAARSSDDWQFIASNEVITYYGRPKDIHVLPDGHRRAWIGNPKSLDMLQYATWQYIIPDTAYAAVAKYVCQ